MLFGIIAVITLAIGVITGWVLVILCGYIIWKFDLWY